MADQRLRLPGQERIRRVRVREAPVSDWRRSLHLRMRSHRQFGRPTEARPRRRLGQGALVRRSSPWRGTGDGPRPPLWHPRFPSPRVCLVPARNRLAEQRTNRPRGCSRLRCTPAGEAVVGPPVLRAAARGYRLKSTREAVPERRAAIRCRYGAGSVRRGSRLLATFGHAPLREADRSTGPVPAHPRDRGASCAANPDGFGRGRLSGLHPERLLEDPTPLRSDRRPSGTRNPCARSVDAGGAAGLAPVRWDLRRTADTPRCASAPRAGIA